MQSVGIDTEAIVTPETRRELATEVASAVEWDLFEGLALSPEQCFSLVFSAKEAFYKCCYPLVKTYFGFEHGIIEGVDATTIRVRTPKSHPRFGDMPNSLDVHYLVSAQDVFCATWLEPRQ